MCLMAAASGPGWKPTHPRRVNVYGQTKLEGEQLVIGALSAAPDFPDQLGLCSAWWQFCENHVAPGAGDGIVLP
jgi:hypothetical protein